MTVCAVHFMCELTTDANTWQRWRDDAGDHRHDRTYHLATDPDEEPVKHTARPDFLD